MKTKNSRTPLSSYPRIFIVPNTKKYDAKKQSIENKNTPWFPNAAINSVKSNGVPIAYCASMILIAYCGSISWCNNTPGSELSIDFAKLK